MSSCKSIIYKIVPLPRQDVWDLMWRADRYLHFLGRQAQVELKAGGLLRLGDEASNWRTASIDKVNTPKSITMHIDPPSSWHLAQQTEAIIYINRLDDSHSKITIIESNIPSQYFEEVTNYWDRRLDYLYNLVKNVNKRRKKVRQAVVVIHGIGEQQPGETLYNLMNSDAFAKNAKLDKWVKPDDYSDSYELRKVTLKGTKTRPTTDVYEFYWAHIIRDTNLDQISSWVRSLLWRAPKSVPRPLFRYWLLAWLVLLVSVGATVTAFAGVEFVRWLAPSSWVLALGLLLWRLFGKKFAIDYIGDAARYLRPHPANIAHRHAIRESGVSLIERLHNSEKYDRIVLVGHSLGSVIAYDILTYSWIRMHDKHQQPSNPAFTDVIDVEKASLHDKESESAFQGQQYAAWSQQRANCQPWLITDLVTIGSPLTYADFLIVANNPSFKDSKEDRILPTCPPRTKPNKKYKNKDKMRMTYELNYTEPLSGKARTFVVFDHGAPFGVTRWTNLYFKVKHCGLSGDIIGGPIKAQLGKGVRDVPLDSPWKGFSHTFYWREIDNKKYKNKHFPALQDALHLDSRVELMKVLNRIPAFALLPKSARPSNIWF